MNRQRLVTIGRELYDLGRTKREQLLRGVADIGLAMVGLVGLMSGPGLVGGWNHHLHLGSPPGQGGVLAVSALTGCVLAGLTWFAFTLHYTTATRVGTVLLGTAGLAVAVSAVAAPSPGTQAAPSEAVAAGLALITLIGFCPAIYLSAPTPSRRDTRDRALPKLSWPVALPFYLLTYGLALTGLYLSLDVDDSAFVGGGNPLSVINYAIGALGFAAVGALRSRATSAYSALSTTAATTLSVPLALGGLLLAATTHQPVTGPVIELAAMVVLIPALGWLAHHRATTAPLPTNAPLAPATASDLEGSA